MTAPHTLRDDLPLAAAACLAAVLFVGCDGGASAARDEPAAPPVPVAPATPPEGVSASELRRRLGANENARFVRSGGTISQVELYDSGVTDLAPLRGLPLRTLGISGLPVEDLSPLAGMPLEVLTAEGTPVADLSPLEGVPLREAYLRETQVADLSPLADAPLEMLNVVGTRVTDLTAVRDLPLNTLWIGSTQVSDLSPLAGKSLESLDVEAAPVADLSVLADMPTLRRLNVAGTAVADLTPLAGLRLERLIFTPSKIERGLEAVREMPSLQTLGTNFDTLMPAAEFWRKHDAGEFATQARESSAQ